MTMRFYFRYDTQMVVLSGGDPAPDWAPITPAVADQVLAQRDAGAVFSPDDGGQPVASFPAPPTTPPPPEAPPEAPAPSEAELARWRRDRRMTPALDALSRHRNQKDYGLATTLTDAQAAEVAEYAEALRHVPEQAGFPSSIQWPQPPEVLGA